MAGSEMRWNDHGWVVGEGEATTDWSGVAAYSSGGGGVSAAECVCVCEIGEMETEREESGDGEHGLGVGTVWEPRCAGRPVDSPAKPLPPHAREVTAACHLHVQRKKKATGHRDGKGRGKSEQQGAGGARNR